MSPIFGEEVWLKTEQDDTCRLYGCDEFAFAELRLKDESRALPPVIDLCMKHAHAIKDGELHVAGVVPPPKEAA